MSAAFDVSYIRKIKLKIRIVRSMNINSIQDFMVTVIQIYYSEPVKRLSVWAQMAALGDYLKLEQSASK